MNKEEPRLDTRSHEVNGSLEHPYREMYLSNTFACVLTAGDKVQCGPPIYVVTKGNAFSGYSLQDKL